MAAVVQHPDGVAAPSSNNLQPGASINPEALPLGHPPHMLRGQLGTFSQLALTGICSPEPSRSALPRKPAASFSYSDSRRLIWLQHAQQEVCFGVLV